MEQTQQAKPIIGIDSLPNEMYFELFQYVDKLSDFQNCRRVCQKWKFLVTCVCQRKFQFIYPLTSSTLYSAGDLTENPGTIDIYSLSTKENQTAWSASGVEQLFENADSLQFSGSKLGVEDIRKILGHAKESVKTLSFSCFQKNLIHPFCGMSERFSALHSLSIGYYCDDKENGSFRSFTTALESWASVECRAELPSLEKLKLYFNGRSSGTSWRPATVVVEDIIRNYLAIGKVLLKYKQTLRDVHIERVTIQGFPLVTRGQHQPEWTERRRGLEALSELRLNHLKICTTDRNRQPAEVDTFGTPSNLNDLLFEMLIGQMNNIQMLNGIIASFNNRQSLNLRSVRIGLILFERIDPVLTIDFGVFRGCANLRELRLWIRPKTRPGYVLVRNVEGLPKGISSFHMEPNKELGYNVAKQVLLKRRQVLWIIRNLRELESFSGCLTIQGINANVQEEGAVGVRQNQQVQGITDETNIDLETFQELISMPKLKDVRVNMIRARALAMVVAQNWVAARETPYTEFSDVEEYTDMCQAAGLKTTTTPSSNIGYSAFGYVKVAIQKKN